MIQLLSTSTIGAFMISLYIIFAIFSCGYSYRMMTRPGMSAEIRKEFIKRHFSYVLIYILTWLPYLGECIFGIYIAAHNPAETTVIELKTN